MLLVLGIVKYLHFFHVPIFFAHISQESLIHVVVELRKCHFFWRNGSHVPLINLETHGKTRNGLLVVFKARLFKIGCLYYYSRFNSYLKFGNHEVSLDTPAPQAADARIPDCDHRK